MSIIVYTINRTCAVVWMWNVPYTYAIEHLVTGSRCSYMVVEALESRALLGEMCHWGPFSFHTWDPLPVHSLLSDWNARCPPVSHTGCHAFPAIREWLPQTLSPNKPLLYYFASGESFAYSNKRKVINPRGKPLTEQGWGRECILLEKLKTWISICTYFSVDTLQPSFPPAKLYYLSKPTTMW